VKKGCCFGCLAVALLVFAGLCALVYAVTVKLDLITPAPRADTVYHAAQNPAVCIRLDPNQPEILKIMDEVFGAGSAEFYGAFFPYEAGLAIVPDTSRNVDTLVVSVSLRRLASLFTLFVKNTFTTEIPGQIISMAEEQNGLWVLRFEMPLAPETTKNAATWWTPTPQDPLVLSGKHAVELLLDNRNGGAFLALEPLFGKHQPDPDEIVVMKAPFEVNAPFVPGLYQRTQSVWLAADFAGPDLIHVEMDVLCRTPQAAESVLFFLFMVRDALYRQLIELDMTLSGDFDVDGSAIHGEFNASGCRNYFVHVLEEQMQ